MTLPVQKTFTLLGVEASCDDTAAAVVTRSNDGKASILSNIVLGQVSHHEAFGGVVPEIAARAHVGAMDDVVAAAMRQAGCEWDDIDGVAATAGPGLMGGLLVGTMTGKALAAAIGKPFLPINHLEGHALTPRLTDGAAFPYVLLLVSGGHTQILLVTGVGAYERLATTIDDAIGEAFDKTAKLLGLGFPGGPQVEEAAKRGDANVYSFPQPMRGHDTLNMSFSGLKTAVRQAAEAAEPLSDQVVADLCASFQRAVTETLYNRLSRVMDQLSGDVSTLVVAGGVGANTSIRTMLEMLCVDKGWQSIVPPAALCTDNAAMIAWAGAERMALGAVSEPDFAPRSRWPLDEGSDHLVGYGRRGVKV